MNLVVFAQEATGSALPSLIFLALMIGVFYFLIIRPQRKRARAQQELAGSLQQGDEVRTIGGLHGVVVSIDDDSIVLQLVEGKVRVSKRAIGVRVGDDS